MIIHRKQLREKISSLLAKFTYYSKPPIVTEPDEIILAEEVNELENPAV
jgi:hypothetical protein